MVFFGTFFFGAAFFLAAAADVLALAAVFLATALVLAAPFLAVDFALVAAFLAAGLAFAVVFLAADFALAVVALALAAVFLAADFALVVVALALAAVFLAAAFGKPEIIFLATAAEIPAFIRPFTPLLRTPAGVFKPAAIIFVAVAAPTPVSAVRAFIAFSLAEPFFAAISRPHTPDTGLTYQDDLPLE